MGGVIRGAGAALLELSARGRLQSGLNLIISSGLRLPNVVSVVGVKPFTQGVPMKKLFTILFLSMFATGAMAAAHMKGEADKKAEAKKDDKKAEAKKDEKKK